MKIDKGWIEKQLPPKIIPRTLTAKLLREIEHDEVAIVYGPRQVGKSTEVMFCISEWLKKNPKLEIFYYNLDFIPSDFENPEKLLQALTAQKHLSQKAILVLDEAQRLPNLGLFIKYIYDQKPPFKIIITGSASLEIRQKIKEPLTGRKREYFMMPLSVEEILEHRGLNPEKLKSGNSITEDILNELMLFGAYPGVHFLATEDKISKLKELVLSYLYKDLAELFGLKDEFAIKVVATFLAENIGNLLNKESLSRLSGVTKHEISKIIDALEKMYIIALVKPFSGSKTKEFVHASKIYFLDVGIRNALLGKLDKAAIVTDKGKIFENIIFSNLLSRYGLLQLRFWRTRNGTEIDFVIDDSGKLGLVECKYHKKSNYSGAMRSFSEKYNHKKISFKLVLDSSNYWKVP